QSAARDGSDPAPFLIRDLKDLVHDLLRRNIAFVVHGAHILVFHSGLAVFQLLHKHENRFQQINRFKSTHHHWHAEITYEGLIFLIAHDRAHVTWRNECVDTILW